MSSAPNARCRDHARASGRCQRRSRPSAPGTRYSVEGANMTPASRRKSRNSAGISWALAASSMAAFKERRPIDTVQCATHRSRQPASVRAAAHMHWLPARSGRRQQSREPAIRSSRCSAKNQDSCCKSCGASGGTRTPTPSRVPDFESGASTGSATEAIEIFRIFDWRVSYVYPKVTAFVKPTAKIRLRVSYSAVAPT